MPGTRNRRDALLAAALEGFTHRGYDATSIAELAATTGMSKAAVSYHFRTKDDLLHALADPLLDSMDAIVERHPRAPGWPGEVRALLDDYLTTLTEHSRIAAWVDTDKAVLNHPPDRRSAAPQHRHDLPGHHRLQPRRQHGHRTRDSSPRITLAPGPHPGPAQLATHRDALIDAAMAGCAPTVKRPDPPHRLA
jgi:AcrR family transcriptional regulator